jgi:hypothetical protein
VTFLKQKLLKTSETFETKDARGTSIILELHQSDIRFPQLAAFKRDVSELACQILAPHEIQFLQACPQAVTHELFFNLTTFFEGGIEKVDWKGVEEKIKSTIKQFYSIYQNLVLKSLNPFLMTFTYLLKIPGFFHVIGDSSFTLW